MNLLDTQERMTDAIYKSWVDEVSSTKDGLYEKLSSSTEGWNIKLDDQLVDVPLSKLDAGAYKILLQTISTKKRVAIALPRVMTGVSLSIIAYLVVNRFLKHQQRAMSDFIPLPLNNAFVPTITQTRCLN
jgi:hypothetical protein